MTTITKTPVEVSIEISNLVNQGDINKAAYLAVEARKASARAEFSKNGMKKMTVYGTDDAFQDLFIKIYEHLDSNGWNPISINSDNLSKIELNDLNKRLNQRCWDSIEELEEYVKSIDDSINLKVYSVNSLCYLKSKTVVLIQTAFKKNIKYADQTNLLKYNNGTYKPTQESTIQFYEGLNNRKFCSYEQVVQDENTNRLDIHILDKYMQSSVNIEEELIREENEKIIADDLDININSFDGRNCRTAIKKAMVWAVLKKLGCDISNYVDDEDVQEFENSLKQDDTANEFLNNQEDAS